MRPTQVAQVTGACTVFAVTVRLMYSAARWACAAAVKIARLSCARTSNQVAMLGCMILARFQGEFEVRTQERRSKLSDQFLDGIAFTTEPMSTEVTIESARAPGPVRAFMGQG